MLKCREVTAMASDFLDHNLTARERWRVRTHLLICVHCRRFLRQLALVVSVLRRHSARHSQASDPLLQRCEAAVLSRLDERRR